MASTPYSWRDLQTGRDLQAGRDLKPTDKGDSMGVTETAAPAGATAVLVLADGTMFWGARLWRSYAGGWRGGVGALLQHWHDRVSGDADRSFLWPGR